MNYTKFLKWSIISGLVLSLLTPFIVADGGISWAAHPFSYIPFLAMFFPYITGKNFLFRIIVEILIGLYVILAIRDPKYRPKTSLTLWSIGGFVVWMALATALSVDPVKSFWGNFERMDGYITVLHLFAYFIISGAILTAENWWKRFFQISVGVSIYQGLIAISQVLHLFGLAPSSQSGVRADGTFGNATYLAVYMLLNLFITLFLIAGVMKEKKGIAGSPLLMSYYGIALVLQFAGLFFTETRGALLGLVGGIIIASIYLVVRGRGKEYQLVRRSVWGVLGVLVILGGLFLAFKDSSFVRNSAGLSRLASISLTDKTTASRFIIWNMALHGAAEKPVFGWGQENFSYVFNKYYNPEMYDQEQWFDRAHNEFFDWLVAGGTPALLFYISFFLLALWAIARAKDLSVPEQAILYGLLAAYVINNLVVFDNLLSLMYFYLILAFVHGHSRNALPKWMPLSKPGSDQAVAIAAPIVLVVVVGLLYMLNGPGMARAQTLIVALSSQSQDAQLAGFTTALSQGELGRQETVEQLFQFASNSIAPSTSVSPATKQKVYDSTLAAGTALLAQRKDDARLELFMGVFYSQFGNYTAALAEFLKAEKDSPKKQQILFQTGVTYLQSGDMQNALAQFKTAYDLEPNYPDARILYASGLYYAGQSAAADKLLTDGFGTLYYDNDRLLQTYMSTKQYDRAETIWNARIEKSPKDTSLYLGLAGAYFAAGNTAQTIATIRKIEDIDPSQKTQMESIITQIQNGTLKP